METIKDLYLFARNLTFKYTFDKSHQQTQLERELTERTKHFSMEEFRALPDLMLLYNEGSTDDVDPPPSGQRSSAPHTESYTKPKPMFKPRSRNFPDLMTCLII